MDEEVTAVCIDMGTATCKAGFAGDEAPRAVFPTIVGRSKTNSNIGDYQEQKDVYVGNDAL